MSRGYSEAEARELQRIVLANGGTVRPTPVRIAQEAAPAALDAETARNLFVKAALAYGLPEPVPELRFASPRRWRFDWAWILKSQYPKRLCSIHVALEIQGGLHTHGRHTRGAALVKEYEKLNTAQLMGWKVLLVTPQQVKSGEAFELVKQALGLT